MSEEPDWKNPFSEPKHPEVIADEMRIASDATKTELFDLLQSVTKDGVAVTTVPDDPPMLVVRLVVPDGTTKLELAWDNPEGDRELSFGTVLKSIQPNIASGETDEFNIFYILSANPSGIQVHKEIGVGADPASNTETDHLYKGPSEELTEDTIAEFAAGFAKRLLSPENLETKRMENEIGINQVSEAEARELISLIQNGTPSI